MNIWPHASNGYVHTTRKLIKLSGIATIRANNAKKYFTEKFEGVHDAHTQTFFSFIAASRWVGFRMDSLAFLPLRCPSNSLIMASFYILVLIYASCGTLWICWLSPVPSRPLVWTCCKSFHVLLYAFIFPIIGQNVLWSCFFIICILWFTGFA